LLFEILRSENFWPEKNKTDENRAKQVIINLLSNALKYTQKGFVRVKSYVNLSMLKFGIVIEDSGVGMT
jgi:signal transduction histidine kinase